jgi:manganese/zinc/iron transport system permease protein
LCGGAIAGIIGVMCMNYMVAQTTLKKDAILGIILSVFFGFGLVLMTVAQKIPSSNQALLNKFLFGNVATLLEHDISAIALISCFIAVALLVCWKEITVYVFDPIFTQLIGYTPRRIELVLTILLVLAIVMGLQTVGVVLMSTMLIAPAAAARQWTERLLPMVLLAGFFGGCSAAIGVYVSCMLDHVPTGPAIVIAASCIVAISLLCGPRAGVAR